jgi:hypothetical protein
MGIVSRALVVAVGGWIVVHVAGAGLGGLAVVAAAGVIAYGAVVTLAFRSSAAFKVEKRA